MLETVLIVDFGSQVTQLIARRLRENGVYCEIYPFNKVEEILKDLHPSALILSGGPASVTAKDGPKAPEKLFKLGIPILGICYGQQTMCEQLGGRVVASEEREFGRATLKVISNCKLFEGLWRINESHQVWMSHGDSISELPKGFKTVGESGSAPFAVIADDERKFYGVQFHPEVLHTLEGTNLLKNFTHVVAGCKGNWTMGAYREQAIFNIRKKVGKAKVICGLSGGVDSSVTAVLIHEAIGDQITCVFVDTGLLRENEAHQVISVFRENYNIPLIHRDASDLFLKNLAGVTDPEEKRKIIGSTFIDVFDKEAKKIGGAEFLAQGTLYPDVIESVSVAAGKNVTIKSHHNVGGLPEHMDLALVEPLKDLFKDEVRKLGHELKLPGDLVGRHPFPGPGLAIRIPGEITPKKLTILRSADLIYLEEISKAGLYDKIWQAFVVLLPVRTVGVMGDARSYDYSCVLRAVTSSDGMTADTYPFEHSFLSHVATRIVNEVNGINRVAYDVTSKPPGTIEWE
ncbi:MAG: glutamine-hydrolyzing GMP synthase [Pseudomonadota bacterium]|nr:glutamine-hydrolyzing GMP synthase [Pseudomonadota bacterium]